MHLSFSGQTKWHHHDYPIEKVTVRENRNNKKAPALVPHDFFQLHWGIELDHNKEKQNLQFHVFPFLGQPV